MKVIKTVKGIDYEMECSEEQAEVLLKDSRYRNVEKTFKYASPNNSLKKQLIQSRLISRFFKD